MKLSFLLAGMGCIVLLGCQAETTKETISVVGKAEIEVMPDSFEVSGYLFETAQNREELLNTISPMNESILQSVRGIENLENVRIETSALEISPQRERKCVNDANYRNEDNCPIVSYSASIEYFIVGAPADEAGNVVSMLTSLGAQGSQIEEFVVSDPVSANLKAASVAFKNAKQNAEAMVEQSGITVGNVVSIVAGNVSDVTYEMAFALPSAEADTVIVTGSRITTIDVMPSPIKFDAEVMVEFEIVQAPSE